MVSISGVTCSGRMIGSGSLGSLSSTTSGSLKRFILNCESDLLIDGSALTGPVCSIFLTNRFSRVISCLRSLISVW